MSARRSVATESATTETFRLPGLESLGLPERPEVTTGHWIERGPSEAADGLLRPLAPGARAAIAEKLGVELGEIELETFANGETYCRYCESIRGADLFLVQTGCQPVDRNLMELLLMIQAAKLASAKRITAVIPWFPTRARTGRRSRASRSPAGSSPTCCSSPAPTAS